MKNPSVDTGFLDTVVYDYLVENLIRDGLYIEAAEHEVEHGAIDQHIMHRCKQELGMHATKKDLYYYYIDIRAKQLELENTKRKKEIEAKHVDRMKQKTFETATKQYQSGGQNYYELAKLELDLNKFDENLMAFALSETEYNHNKAKSIYIRERANQLKLNQDKKKEQTTQALHREIEEFEHSIHQQYSNLQSLSHSLAETCDSIDAYENSPVTYAKHESFRKKRNLITAQIILTIGFTSCFVYYFLSGYKSLIAFPIFAAGLGIAYGYRVLSIKYLPPQETAIYLKNIVLKQELEQKIRVLSDRIEALEERKIKSNETILNLQK